MIKLTDRLQVIASQVSNGEKIADIGTDHGLLPLYLWEQQISPKVIMTDASAGSLQKAKENCNAFYPEETFDTRLGNGLEVIKSSEVDTIVIAGMGGMLISEILGANIDKTFSIKKYILQPRSAIGKLRHWLLNNGFSISKDVLVREGKFICTVITAENNENSNLKEIQEHIYELKELNPDDIRLDVPVWICKDSLAKELIDRRIDSERRIIEKSAIGKNKEKYVKSKFNLKYLEDLNEYR